VTTTAPARRPTCRPHRAAALALALGLAGAGCAEDLDLGDRGGDAADVVADRIDDVVAVASGPVGSALETLDARADCLADGAVDTLGEERAEDYDVGDDPMGVAQEAGATVGEVSDAVEACLDLKPFLVDVLTGAGASDADAGCIADFILDNDRLREPILLQLLLGDPGVLTAIGLAARGATTCDLGPEVALDLPGW
jgi:hypothetical protein